MFSPSTFSLQNGIFIRSAKFRKKGKCIILYDIQSSRKLHVFENSLKNIKTSGNFLINYEYKVIKVYDLYCFKFLYYISTATKQKSYDTIYDLKIYHNYLIVNLYKSIQIYNLCTGEFLCKIIFNIPNIPNIHYERIKYIEIYKNKVFTNISDSDTINIWDINTGKCLHSIVTYQDWRIKCFTICGYEVFIGSLQGTLWCWNIESGELLYKLRKDVSEIENIVVIENKIYTAQRIGHINIWDSTTKNLLYQFQRNIIHRIDWYKSFLIITNSNIIVNSYNFCVSIWNKITYQLLYILVGHTKLINYIVVHGSKIVTGSDDNTVKIWDINTGQLLHTLEGHKSPIMYIQIYKNKVFTYEYDEIVKIWDIDTFKEINF